MSTVVLIMGSDSDLPIVSECESILKEFAVSFETRVLSAHRTPEETRDAIRTAEKSGTKVFIAFAGLAAHLPGVIASFTSRPVIGVPIGGGALNGIDALYSIVQMPGGVPVACMAIGKSGAKNAALFALQILSLSNESIVHSLETYKHAMRDSVLAKDREVRDRA